VRAAVEPPPPPSQRELAPPPSAREPAWLERGPSYARATAVASNPNKITGQGDELAAVIAVNPAQWMQQLARSNDPRAFAKLESAVRSLAASGDVHTLWTVVGTLQTMSQGSAASGELASRALRAFEDPSVLALVAEHLLTGDETSRETAKRILVQAGVAGAYGLYGARVKLAGDPSARGPFGAAIAEFGAKAWPVVRAALEKILATPGSTANAATMELAEDLVLCVPLIGDEQAGHVVVKYLRVNVSGVCRAATAAIVKLWGERAKPLLVGMLQSKDDVVRIAGIAGLRQLEGIDEHVVPRLHAILTKRVPAGDELRAASAVALGHATASARTPAISLLTQLVTPARDTPHERTTAGTAGGTLSREDAILIALARSLLAVGGMRYRSLVAERSERSPEPLRSQLRRLLAG